MKLPFALTDVRRAGMMKEDNKTAMAMVQSRNRLIYFRVSEEELARFRSMAERLGARSLSDLAREALHRLEEPRTGMGMGNQKLAENLETLCTRVEEMYGRLEEMNERLGFPSPSRAVRAVEGESTAA